MSTTKFRKDASIRVAIRQAVNFGPVYAGDAARMGPGIGPDTHGGGYYIRTEEHCKKLSERAKQQWVTKRASPGD